MSVSRIKYKKAECQVLKNKVLGKSAGKVIFQDLTPSLTQLPGLE